MPADPSSRSARRSLRIGKFDIVAPATLASLGAVYKAEDVEAHRQVVLKVLPPELMASVVGRDRFQREAQRAARVQSPYVVKVHDFGDANGTWYLALECIEGDSLLEHVKRHGPMSADVARPLLEQAAQALYAVHRQGIVPHDLGPASFLVPRGSGEEAPRLIKLLDLGLLRPLKDDLPGDIRAAIHALGRTAFYLITGDLPAKPDVGSLGPKVPGELKAVLRKMIAQKADRFPDPSALLEALGVEPPAEAPDEEEAPPEPRDVLAALAGSGAASAADSHNGTRSPAPVKEAAPKPRYRDEETAAEGGETPGQAPDAFGKRTMLLWALVGFVAVIVIGAIILAASTSGGRSKKGGGLVIEDRNGRKPEDGGGDRPRDAGGKTEPGVEKPPEPPAPKPPPRLYEPAVPIDPVRLLKEFEGPWASAAPPPADSPVFRVTRAVSAFPDAKPGTVFDSLSAAIAAVPAGKWGVIEIYDNGPIFEGPVSAAGRNLLIRAGPNYRPLLVWDRSKAGGSSQPPAAGNAVPAFLSVDQGSLTLWGVDVAADCPDRAGPAALLRVSGGDLYVLACTFSAGGKSKAPVAVARFEAGAGKKCRLSYCFGRGANLVAAESLAPGADLMIDNSLMVGGEYALLQVAGGTGDADATTLRFIRATLIGRETLLDVRAPAAQGDPALRWLGWDVLLVRAADGAGGTLVSLPAGSGPGGMKWRAVNSLYTGWKTLLSGREPVAGSDGDGWRRLWRMSEGDVSMPSAFSPGMPADPSLEPKELFSPAGTPLAFAATFGAGLLGCDVTALPLARANWRWLACERAELPPVEALEPGSYPAIPMANDGLYHGERLDLDRIDLGAYLAEVQKKHKLAPEVVLHLFGTGKRKTSPIFLKGDPAKGGRVWLCFEPPREGAEPLVLTPDPNVAPTHYALIQAEDLGLEIIGGDLRCPDFKTALVPHYLVMVTRGNLRLAGTRLQGPISQPPEDYWGLVRLEGSGLSDWKWVRGATFTDCVLLSGRLGLHLFGVGARVRLHNSVLVASRALQFQPGTEAPAALNLQVSLDHCTVAARETVLYLEDTPAWSILLDPIYLQSAGCAYLNPFLAPDGKSPRRAGFLMYEGLALQRGVLAWQGDGDLFDPRLYAYVGGPGPDGLPAWPDKPQTHALWGRLWGAVGDRQPILDVPLRMTLDLEKLPLENLTLPAHPALRKASPGADLVRLGIVKKKK